VIRDFVKDMNRKIYLKSLYKKSILILMAVIFPVLISGCARFAHLPEKDAPVAQLDFVYLSPEIEEWPDKKLRNTFSDYWYKRFTGKPSEEIFNVEAPHFQKMVNFSRYDAYLNNFPKGEILRIEIAYFIPVTEYLYEIPMTIVFQGPRGQEQKMSVRDRWVMVEEQWYHVLRDPLAFPKIG